MSNYNELQALREYAKTLQNQNEAKTIEQLTLYRELEALETELKKMEIYCQRNRLLNQQVASLRTLLRAQQQDLELAGQRQRLIQAISQEKLLLEQSLDARNQQLAQLQAQSQKQNYQIQSLEHELAALNHQIKLIDQQRQEIQSVLDQKQEENQSLIERIQYLSLQQNQQASKNLHELAQNYEKIELVVLEKEETIQEMETYINQLEYQCQLINQELIKSQNHARRLQYELKSIQMRKSTRDKPDDNLSFLTDSISKVDLMRQNNRMLERIVKFEKENSGNDNLQQRHSYSQCGDASNTNSPTKLQMRIKTLKIENQGLLRTLAI